MALTWVHVLRSARTCATFREPPKGWDKRKNKPSFVRCTNMVVAILDLFFDAKFCGEKIASMMRTVLNCQKSLNEPPRSAFKKPYLRPRPSGAYYTDNHLSCKALAGVFWVKEKARAEIPPEALI